ncbi:unnamed protein product [Soboliphyme baturini]|uniref:Thioredoxin domain-containing protein n=1 Tax=Soboliphyme baturini TaxID=241478 RepID=A0A183IYG0_9BILA|nr:unnamed protein product [Soboliphyme baturini]
MQLLPQFRKVAKILGNSVRFGTIDCEAHEHLCRSVDVNSYPTTILYNNSVPNIFVGYHTAGQLMEFVEDVKHPPVIDLTAREFEVKVLERSKDEAWVVDFYAPWCSHCIQFEPQYKKLAKLMRISSYIHVSKVDCSREHRLCNAMGVHSFPTIRLYPFQNGPASDYNHWSRDANSLRRWIYGSLPSNVVMIGSRNFNSEVFFDKQPWLINFFAPWCGHCHNFAPYFEEVARVRTSYFQRATVFLLIHVVLW